MSSISRPRGVSPSASSADVRAPQPETPPREHLPNLSPTRAPVVAADVALWPNWTDTPFEDLDLDSFDDCGNLVCGEA